jgi:hypothetical protein
MGHLWDALSCAYDALGFDVAAGGDEVFRGLVLARIIEPASKLDSLRVLDEAGVVPPSYATTKKQVSLAAHLSRWMATSGAGPGDLTSDAAERQPPMTWAPAADLSISQMMPQRSTLVQTSRSGED